jgi:hypothetical protein
MSYNTKREGLSSNQYTTQNNAYINQKRQSASQLLNTLSINRTGTTNLLNTGTHFSSCNLNQNYIPLNTEYCRNGLNNESDDLVSKTSSNQNCITKFDSHNNPIQVCDLSSQSTGGSSSEKVKACYENPKDWLLYMIRRLPNEISFKSVNTLDSIPLSPKSREKEEVLEAEHISCRTTVTLISKDGSQKYKVRPSLDRNLEKRQGGEYDTENVYTPDNNLTINDKLIFIDTDNLQTFQVKYQKIMYKQLNKMLDVVIPTKKEGNQQHRSEEMLKLDAKSYLKFYRDENEKIKLGDFIHFLSCYPELFDETFLHGVTKEESEYNQYLNKKRLSNNQLTSDEIQNEKLLKQKKYLGYNNYQLMYGLKKFCISNSEFDKIKLYQDYVRNSEKHISKSYMDRIKNLREELENVIQTTKDITFTFPINESSLFVNKVLDLLEILDDGKCDNEEVLNKIINYVELSIEICNSINWEKAKQDTLDLIKNLISNIREHDKENGDELTYSELENYNHVYKLVTILAEGGHFNVDINLSGKVKLKKFLVKFGPLSVDNYKIFQNSAYKLKDGKYLYAEFKPVN